MIPNAHGFVFVDPFDIGGIHWRLVPFNPGLILPARVYPGLLGPGLGLPRYSGPKTIQ